VVPKQCLYFLASLVFTLTLPIILSKQFFCQKFQKRRREAKSKILAFGNKKNLEEVTGGSVFGEILPANPMIQ
jgi:hypothetical protein